GAGRHPRADPPDHAPEAQDDPVPGVPLPGAAAPHQPAQAPPASPALARPAHRPDPPHLPGAGTAQGVQRGPQARHRPARGRGRELLAQLPDGSRVLILDTADPVLSGKGEWLTSMHQVGKRIDGLRLRHGGGPVTTRVEDAYRLFDDLARSKSDDATRHLARL